LRGSYIPFIFVKPSLFDRSQFVLKMFFGIYRTLLYWFKIVKIFPKY
jgi:hypothetical protein